MTKRTAVSVACAAAVALGAVSLGAQTTPSARSGPPTTSATPFSPKPFGRLFEEPALRPRRFSPPGKPLWRISPRPAIAPEMRCDLIVIRPSPRLDPTFERRPYDGQLRYGMRTGPVSCR